jgi:hypothetical protein
MTVVAAPGAVGAASGAAAAAPGTPAPIVAFSVTTQT